MSTTNKDDFEILDEDFEILETAAEMFEYMEANAKAFWDEHLEVEERDRDNGRTELIVRCEIDKKEYVGLRADKRAITLAKTNAMKHLKEKHDINLSIARRMFGGDNFLDWATDNLEGEA